MLSTYLLTGIIVCFSPVLGFVNLPLPFSPSSTMNDLAELAIWESLGTSNAHFDESAKFMSIFGTFKKPDYNTLKFVLFNRANRKNGREITADPDVLKKFLNPSVPTKMFIHGFKNNIKSEIPVLIRNAYLDHADYNMIHVDWAELAAPPNYVAARSHAVGVANRTALLLNALADSGICLPKNQHILGHSLGAHIAGLASGHAKTKPGRCTGLDPAGPLFQISSRAGRIDSSDADLVDIIHTTAAFWGFPGPVGHVDFYPNGGVWPQPGCFFDIDGDCSHGMAAKFFAYTIRHPHAFRGPRCQTHRIIRDECPAGTENATMGEHITFKTPGMYYVDANIPKML